MAKRIPVSTSFVESAIITAPLASIWPLVKPERFVDFYTAISKSESIISDDGESIVRWTFPDGTMLYIREEEYSTLKHSMSFNIFKCEPWGLPYTDARSTMRLFAITSGYAKGSTYVEWRGNYSSDASEEDIEDAKLKRREGLEDLARYFDSKQTKNGSDGLRQ